MNVDELSEFKNALSVAHSHIRASSVYNEAVSTMAGVAAKGVAQFLEAFNITLTDDPENLDKNRLVAAVIMAIGAARALPEEARAEIAQIISDMKGD